jgi:MbtH protein
MDERSADSVGSEEGYTVLVNEEEQYSLWPQKVSVPAGWTCIGFYGSKKDCLDHVQQNWRDITPRSVRDRLLLRSQ